MRTAKQPALVDGATQVYEARLKTGDDVVIKVQKPGVAEVLKTDLGFMFVTSKLVEVIASHRSGQRTH